MRDARASTSRLRGRGAVLAGVVSVVTLAGFMSPAVAAASAGGVSRGESAREQAIDVAQVEYAKYHRVQAPIAIPVLPSPPPTGKNLLITTCAVTVCKVVSDAAAVAANKLGWNVNTVILPLGAGQAQGLTDMWNHVIANPPDLMAYEGTLPDSQVQPLIDQAAAKGVKIVDLAPKGTIISPTGPIYAEVNSPDVLALSGRLMGDSIVQDARRHRDHVVWITDPTRAFFVPAQTALTKVVTSAGGTVDTLGISLSDVGIGVPGKIVAYILAHPHLKYLAFALNDMTAGVPTALKAAGLANRVKIVSRAPSASAISDIQSGAQWKSVTEEVASAGWRSIDQLARLVEGVPMTADISNPVGWHMIIDKSNVGTNSTGPSVPGFPSSFLTAWHIQ